MITLIDQLKIINLCPLIDKFISFFLSFVTVPQGTVIRNMELVWYILRHYRDILVYLCTMALKV